MKVTLRPHQLKAVDKLANGKILCGGVGSGKSLTALAYYYTKACKGVLSDSQSMRDPKDLYIITTAKKRDSLEWMGEAAKMGLGASPEDSVGNVRVTVDSWNNISKYETTKDAFFIFDEQRLVGSGAWTKSFLKIAKENQWILLSATPGDTWLDYIPVFLANGFYKHRTAFKREHVIYNSFSKYPKVDRYVGVNKLLKHRNAILVDMPYAKHTVRHTKRINVEYDQDLYMEVVKNRWHVYEQRPLKNISETASAMRKVVNSHSSRLTAIQELMKKHAKLIVFYNFNYELEQLRTLSDFGVNLNLAEEKPTLQKSLRNGSTEKEAPTPKTFSEPASGDMSVPPWDIPATFPTGTSDVPGADLTGGCSECLEKTSSGTSTVTSYNLMSTKKCSCETTSSFTTRDEKHQSPRLNLINSRGSNSGMLSSTSSGKTALKHSETTTRVDSKKNTGSLLSELPMASSTSMGNPPSASSRQTIQKQTVTKSDSVSLPTATFALAEWNGQKHEPIPKTDRWVYLVQYTAGSEGWNCVETDAIAFYSLTYSFKVLEQAMGRIDRLNTSFLDLYYYLLISRAPLDGAIQRSLKNKEVFNAREFVEKGP